MQAYSIILDLVALGVIVFCTIYYSRKGFVFGLFSLLGTLIALIVAALAAQWLAPAVFETFFRQNMEQSVAEVISAQGITTVGDLLEQTLGFLPVNLIAFIELSLDISLDFGAADIAAIAVDQVIKPVVVPLLAALLFFIIFAMVRILVQALRSLSVRISRIPVVGTVNRMLGAVVGILIGILYVYLALSVLWAYDMFNPQTPVTSTYFGQSIVISLLQGFNIFTNI